MSIRSVCFKIFNIYVFILYKNYKKNFLLWFLKFLTKSKIFQKSFRSLLNFYVYINFLKTN